MGEVDGQKILPPLSAGLRPLPTFPPYRGRRCPVTNRIIPAYTEVTLDLTNGILIP